MRILVGDSPSGAMVNDLTDSDLQRLYKAPQPSWLRVNMVSSLDGAATGVDGKSGSINNAADRRVFDCLRRLADAVLVGAGTARAERYAPIDVPLVVVSRSGDVPETLRGSEAGQVWLVTCDEADHLEEARDLLGHKQVLVVGESHVDLARTRDELATRGFSHVLSEGGPHLLCDMVSQGVLDELDLTVVPRLIGGDHTRILAGPPVDGALALRLMLEEDGTLLMRWST